MQEDSDMTRFLLLLLCLLATPVSATEFEARVTRVKDGDSLLIHRADRKRTSEVRLGGIDAPELAQPWGAEAKAALRRMVEGKNVRVQIVDKDRYNRLVARIWVERTYVNAAMTKSGNAWAFARYMPDRQIRAGHDEARAARRGLWSLPKEKQVPPSTWRQRNPRHD